MKSILYSVCIGGLAVALTTGGAQAQDKRPERARPQGRTANVQAARPGNTGRAMGAQRNVSTAQFRQPSHATQRPGSNFVANRNARLQAMRERNSARNQAFRERTNAAVNRNRNMAVNRSGNSSEFRNRDTAAVNRERNVANRNTQQFRGRNNVAGAVITTSITATGSRHGVTRRG